MPQLLQPILRQKLHSRLSILFPVSFIQIETVIVALRDVEA